MNGLLQIASYPVLCSAMSFAFGQNQDVKPNLLLIVLDDLGYADLSCQGSPDIRTPNIDALAESGIRFTAGYVPVSVCGPSRASLLTGRYAAGFGIQGNGDAEIGIPLETKNIAEYLKRGGYSTKAIGKWHLGFSLEQSPLARGFDEFCGHLSGGVNYLPFSPSGEKWNLDRDRGKIQKNGVDLGVGDLPADTYLTDLFTQEAVQFIEQSRQNPFFIYLAYNAPHAPVMAPDHYVQRNSHIDDDMRRKFAGMMSAVDDGIGSIIDALKKAGLYENTLIVLLSDNGGPTGVNTSLNTPFRGVKGDVFEGGVRIPFMMSWPGTIRKEQVYDKPVVSLDILPTFLSAAGITVNDAFNGIDLLPWIKDAQRSEYPHDLLFFWRAGRRAARFKDIKLTNAQLGSKAELHNIVENYVEDPLSKIKDSETQQMLFDKITEWDSGWAPPVSGIINGE